MKFALYLVFFLVGFKAQAGTFNNIENIFNDPATTPAELSIFPDIGRNPSFGCNTVDSQDQIQKSTPPLKRVRIENPAVDVLVQGALDDQSEEVSDDLIEAVTMSTVIKTDKDLVITISKSDSKSIAYARRYNSSMLIIKNVEEGAEVKVLSYQYCKLPVQNGLQSTYTQSNM